MKNPTIGIKIADGSYFPIMEEGSSKRKRLVLTTVNDNQESVQIDLYKGSGDELLDAAYVGSLLIENIAQGPKESSEIELKLGFDADGTLNAEAGDPGSGQFESLSISMETLGESLMYDTPEFSLDDDIEDLKIDDFDDMDTDLDLDSEELSLDDFDDMDIDLDLDSEELSLDDDMGEETPVPELVEGDLDSDELTLDDDDFDFDDMEEEDDDSLEAEDFEIDLDDNDIFEEKSESISENEFDETEDSDFDNEDDYTPSILSESEMVQPKEKKGGNPLLIALLVLVAIAAIAGISYLLFRSLQGEDSPPLEAKNGTTSVSSEIAADIVTQEEQTDSVVVVPEKQAESPDTISKDAAPQTESTNEEQPLDDASTVPGPVIQEITKITDTTGVWYKIRWGDTLWGISYSFYDSPKDYNDIVKENKIKNPDIIFAETEIFIPSR